MIGMLAAFALGGLGWTLAEYLLHRFDGHGMKGRTRFSREHLAHHGDPSTFGPTHLKVAASVVAGAVLLGGSVPLVGPWTGGAFTTGFLATYLVYEILHRRIHTAAPLGSYGRWLRRHHLSHHHGDPSRNHGVTSPLWDRVFGTLDRVDRVGVPTRRAPAWLRDPETGAVRPAYAADFELVGRTPPIRS